MKQAYGWSVLASDMENTPHLINKNIFEKFKYVKLGMSNTEETFNK